MSLEGRTAERISIGVGSGAALTVIGKDVAAECPRVQGFTRRMTDCHGKELKAKIRTLHSTEMGLGRRIPETHDSLAWLVTHAAATTIGSGQGSMGRHRMSCVWGASFAEW